MADPGAPRLLIYVNILQLMYRRQLSCYLSPLCNALGKAPLKDGHVPDVLTQRFLLP